MSRKVKRFKRILIANRGEIALRVVEACRELGIQSVAVFSEPDRSLPHVQLADVAFCIGPASAGESYLDIPVLMSVAELSGTDAVHPGYGFLAEDPHFVEICEESGLVFIGPSHRTMVEAGDKLIAKRKVAKAEVPVIPGSEGVVRTEDELLEVTNELGYPLIIKATASGGGRGMRVVQQEDQIRLFQAFHAVRREAEAGFGTSDVYVERYIPNPKHIEVQILADRAGNVIHWGERDCSIQRRHQKLIEEAPAPGLNAATRNRIHQAAIQAAKALDYQNVGTVEFIVAGDVLYFLEINARIQVEHPISEMITDRDLIKEQIRLAEGEKLGYSQQEVQFRGHAIECRINAEDPYDGFRPSSGRIRLKQLPGGSGVRIDTHLFDGLEITPHYDSMLAKLIVYGQDRTEARIKMIGALERFDVDGVKTTRDLCRETITHPTFVAGKADTGFLTSEILEVHPSRQTT
ncbi:MAG: acetyl/propionyl/methylcrotonyl-CoA carboxylase subunit alpha [Candidatus Bipolaricaulia bacterium]